METGKPSVPDYLMIMGKRMMTVLIGFSRQSTIHSLSHLAQARNIKQRMFWMIIALSALIGFLINLVNIIETYYERPVLINIYYDHRAFAENNDLNLGAMVTMKEFGNIQKDTALYPLVVMYMLENGDLSNYLHRFAERSDAGVIDGQQFLLWAIQIADGMCYLTFNRFVHSNLAARNCLVGSWTLNKETKYEDFCRRRLNARNHLELRRERPYSNFVLVSPLLVIFTVLGWRVNNVLLAYLTTLFCLLVPGLRYRGLLQIFTERIKPLFRNKLNPKRPPYGGGGRTSNGDPIQMIN